MSNILNKISSMIITSATIAVIVCSNQAMAMDTKFSFDCTIDACGRYKNRQDYDLKKSSDILIEKNNMKACIASLREEFPDTETLFGDLTTKCGIISDKLMDIFGYGDKIIKESGNWCFRYYKNYINVMDNDDDIDEPTKESFTGKFGAGSSSTDGESFTVGTTPSCNLFMVGGQKSGLTCLMNISNSFDAVQFSIGTLLSKGIEDTSYLDAADASLDELNNQLLAYFTDTYCVRNTTTEEAEEEEIETTMVIDSSCPKCSRVAESGDFTTEQKAAVAELVS